MLFADTLTNNSSDKITFFSFNFGTSTIQFFKPQANQTTIAKALPVHYVVKSRATVLCLGDACEICKRNMRIYESSQDPLSDPNFIRKDVRFYSYILNKTLTRRCPYCGFDNLVLSQKEPEICSSCQALLPESVVSEPLNRIQVLAISKSLATEFNNLLFEHFNGDVDKFLRSDILVTTRPAAPGSNSKKRTYSFRIGNMDGDVLSSDGLKPLEDFVIKLTPEEQLMLLDGMSVKDIYTLRRDKNQRAVEETDAYDSLDERIIQLFGK